MKNRRIIFVGILVFTAFLVGYGLENGSFPSGITIMLVILAFAGCVLLFGFLGAFVWSLIDMMLPWEVSEALKKKVLKKLE